MQYYVAKWVLDGEGGDLGVAVQSMGFGDEGFIGV